MENMIAKLVKIQSELKAPKNQYNSFGKYHYRSCEDITEAAKPICAKYGSTLTLSDEIVLVGDRYYVKATVTLTDAETGGTVSCSAYAREDEDKKGMDASQLTGATSSYARKYALSGLFALDDTKDSDFTNNGEEPRRSARPSARRADIPQNVDPAPVEPEIPASAAEEPQYVCCDCGKPFAGFTSKNGKKFNAGQVYHMAEWNNTDGKARCRECAVKAGTRKEQTNG